jgi:hypothetical protein
MLQVLLTHTVVDSRQPRLEIRKDSVHRGKELGGVRPASLGLTVVVTALVSKRTIASPAISMHEAAGSHRFVR